MPLENQASPSPENGPSSRAYIWLRRIFFIACIIVFLLTILYLIYYNGKSIYDNGI